MASEQLAILFADVCDSTTIYEAIGDTRALAAISALFVVLGTKVQDQGGKIVKTLGDGMVCQFKDANSAFRAACDIQEAALAAAADAEPKLAIKVAFNWGPVVTDQGDVFGDTVNVCARLGGVAGPHQVLTTLETVVALSKSLRKRSRPLYPLKVRGRVEEVEVYEVLWRSDPDVTEALSRSQLNVAAARDWVLTLSRGDKVIVIEPSGSVQIGRDKGNDLVVSSTKASRVHARIYGRGRNFVVADQSSNGTFVAIDGSGRELILRREEALLGEGGTIALGGPAAAGDGDHVLRYRLERRKPS
jgi:adenylate cyclase